MAEHRPRRRFGQHFLHDPRIIERIVGAVEPTPGQTIVEIGPGHGALTATLLGRGGRVFALEIDRDLCASLEVKFAACRGFSLVNADALRFDFREAAGDGRLRIVGNLPYNISTPLLFHLLAHPGHLDDLHLMLQREVAERMVAEPRSRRYGRLSVMVQSVASAQALFHIGPGAFKPAPRVSSTFVRLVAHRQAPVTISDREAFAALVRHLFSQRRKTLKTSLRGRLSAQAIHAVGLDPAARPETLDLQGFASLAEALSRCG